MVCNIKGDLEAVKQSDAEGEECLNQPEPAVSRDRPTAGHFPICKRALLPGASLGHQVDLVGLIRPGRRVLQHRL